MCILKKMRFLFFWLFIVGTLMEDGFASEQLSSSAEESTKSSPTRKSTFEEHAKRRRENRSQRQKQREENRTERESRRNSGPDSSDS